MMTEPLRPSRGGFLRPFRCGWFIREFLWGHRPYGAPAIDPGRGAPQSEILRCYKEALIRETAVDRATRQEERRSRQEERAIDPARIEELTARYIELIPYKTTSSRYHSFVTYFSDLKRLGWVEETGEIEQSEFQDRYAAGQPKRYYRLTVAGKAASEAAWVNPHLALYGKAQHPLKRS